MVSPLSSRIINLEAKVKNKKRSNTKGSDKKNDVNLNYSNFPWQFKSRKKRISGYAADGESASASALAFTDDAANAEKQLMADKVETNAKRRRVEERNFQANNVKNDLAAAGKEYIPRSRALPVGTIDMSGVRLVMSSKYKEEQESAPSPLSSSSSISSLSPPSSAMIVTAHQLYSDYVSLFEASTPFYRGTHKQQRLPRTRLPATISDPSNMSDTTGTGGMSLSSSPFEPFDSDEDDIQIRGSATPSASAPASNPSTPLVPKPMQVLKGLVEKLQENKISTMLLTAKPNFISLDSALVCGGTARLIIEAKGPHYNIVHSNASFSRLSGISGDRLIGSSLCRFVKSNESTSTYANTDDNVVEILLPKEQEQDGEEELAHATVNSSGTRKDSIDGAGSILLCKFTVHQVKSYVTGGGGVLNNDTSNTDRNDNGAGSPQFSHFVLDFEKVDAQQKMNFGTQSIAVVG